MRIDQRQYNNNYLYILSLMNDLSIQYQYSKHKVEKIMILSNKPINIILSLSILLFIGQSLDYHLYHKIPNEALDQTVSSIVVINDQNLAVTKSNSTHTNVSIYYGPSFNYKMKQLQVNSMISKPIPTLQGIFINNGKQILEKTDTNQTYQLMAMNITGNMMVNTNNNYAIISKKNLCPTLTFINLTIMKYTQYTFQQGENCTFDYIGFVKEVGKDQVAYAARNNIYILNSQTLAVEQKLQQTDKNESNNYNYLDTYHDQITNKSVILVKGTGSNYKTYIQQNKDKDKGQGQGQGSNYNVQGRFYNPTSQLFLTGINKGISFQGTNVYEWQDMSTNILAIDFNLDDQYLKNKITIAISNNEQLFVLKQKSDKTLLFYTISPTYKIQNTFNITIQQAITISADKTALFTQDDKYLFIQIYNEIDKTYSICKIDIQNKNYTYIYIPETNNTVVANCSSFTLLGKQTDSMICICTVMSINETTNTTINQYYLQLRTVSKLQLINTLELTIGVNPLFKLISYKKWKSSLFVLQVVQQPIKDDNCQTILYQLVGNQIVRKQSNSDISFHKVRPAGSYLLSLKYSQEVCEDYLHIYHAQNLSLFSQIYVPNGCKQLDNYIYGQADILLIQANFNLYKLDVYDFSTDLWYQGSLFKQYYTKTIENYQADYLIFPTKKLYYLYFNGPVQIIDNPTKLIYNLNKPPVKSIFSLQKTQSKPQSYLYIKNTPPKCDSIFYFTNKTLNKFSYCLPYQDVQKYNLDPTDAYTFSAQKLILASSQRHIILIYSVYNSQLYTMQVRQIQRPQIKIFQYSRSAQIFNADYTMEGRFIYNQKNSVFSFMLDVRQYADIYSIKSFTLFDTNSKGCIAFAGPLQNQQSKTRLIFKAISEKQTYTQWDSPQSIDLLKININCTKFAIYKKITNTLQIWSYIPTIVNLFSQVIQGVIDVKFAGDQYIAVKLATEVKIIQYIKQQNRQLVSLTNSNNKLQEQLQILFDTSNDGKIIAKSLDLKCITIAQPSEVQNQLFFCLPSIQYATGLSLAPSNSLSISTQLGNLYYLLPYPCPQTYMSINLVCMCRDHAVQNNGVCQCKKNFFEDNRNCVCLETFRLTDQGQCVCQNGFVQDRVCQECSFPCQTCTQSATNCSSYQAGFIVLVIGACLIGAMLIGAIAYIIRRKKLQKDLSQQKQELVDSVQN